MIKSILFTDSNSYYKPVLAAACLLLSDKSVRVAVATGKSLPETPCLTKVIVKEGLVLPKEIINITEIEPGNFNLIVNFSAKETPLTPPLPGAPPVISWNLAELKNGSETELARQIKALIKKLSQMTNDLLNQGYYTAITSGNREANRLLDQLNEGIIVHDLNRKIFFFNQSAERITGYKRSEVVGRDCHEVFGGGFCKAKCSFCDKGKIGKLPAESYAIHLRTRDNLSKQVEMSVVPIADRLGQIVGVAASFNDVTRKFELEAQLGENEHASGIIGSDYKVLEVLHTIHDLSDSSVSVIIHGESGTGKELVAAAIHKSGKRADKLFVPINCGALPENLLESELFGHVKGAFTGAIKDKKGRFELADGGTLFLDEIGDISPAMQVKLLRVLQDGIIQRVGSESHKKVDVRVVSATHKNLQEEIRKGNFREDLYYRLCVVPIHIPALRERRADIPLLARHFLKKFLAEEEMDNIVLSPEVIDILTSYDWPGNVRELQNVIRYILVRCKEEVAKPYHLPDNLSQAQQRSIQIPSSPTRKNKLNSLLVSQALKETGGNKLKAAKHLGVGRATLYRFLAKNANQIFE